MTDKYCVFKIKHKKHQPLSYSTNLSPRQLLVAKSVFGNSMPQLRKYDIKDVLNALSYVIKTGIQWYLLPEGFPPWKMVYHHFRSWSDRGYFTRLLGILVEGKRCSEGCDSAPTAAVVDSQSVRSALPQSQKGIDGHKCIKGIKRHIAVDTDGYPLSVYVSTANVHDSKAAYPLIANLLTFNPEISKIKADKAYGGGLQRALSLATDADLNCMKSNLGTSEFLPIGGRWVVERTFAWLENYRRLCRNYEKHLHVARHITIVACVFFMMRYF